MIELEVTGVVELMKGLGNALANLRDDTRQTMDTSLLLLEADMREHAPRDTGQLAGSITHGINGSGADLIGNVGPTVRYAAFVEYGTRPHWPPIGAISPWAQRHGISPFLVARSISRRGTRAQPFIGPAWQRNRATIAALFARLGQTVSARIAGR